LLDWAAARAIAKATTGAVARPSRNLLPKKSKVAKVKHHAGAALQAKWPVSSPNFATGRRRGAPALQFADPGRGETGEVIERGGMNQHGRAALDNPG